MADLPRLMLVTDRARCAPRDLVDVVTAAVAGGVSLVQVREKLMPGLELFQLTKQMRTAIQGKALLLINQDVLAVRNRIADGIHLSEAGQSYREVRETVGPGKLIGRSVHSIHVARDAEQSGVDYLVAGSVFATASHPGVPQGLDFLHAVCTAVSIPVFAIGGITRDTVRPCLAAGAHGVAVIGAIIAAADPQQAARALLEEIQDWESQSRP